MKIDHKLGFGFGLTHSFGTKRILPKSPELRQVKAFGAGVMFFFHSLCGGGNVEKAYGKWKERFQKVMGTKGVVRVQVCGPHWF